MSLMTLQLTWPLNTEPHEISSHFKYPYLISAGEKNKNKNKTLFSVQMLVNLRLHQNNWPEDDSKVFEDI